MATRAGNTVWLARCRGARKISRSGEAAVGGVAASRELPGVATFGLAFLACLALRLPALGDLPLWFDEVVTAESIQLPWRALRRERLHVGHFPTYFFFLKLLGFGGASEWMLRIPSVLFDCAAGGVVALIAARLAGWRCAVPAALLYATFPILIIYAQEARPYAAQLFFTTLAMYGQIMVLRGEGSLRRSFALATVGSLGAVLVIPAGAVIVIVQQLALLACGNWPRGGEARKQLVRHLGITWILGGSALLLLLPSVLAQAGRSDGLLKWQTHTPYLERVRGILDGSYGFSVPHDGNLWLPALFNPVLMMALFVSMGAGILAHRTSPVHRYLAIQAGGPLLAFAGLATFSVVSQRYLVGMMPAAILLAASGVAHLAVLGRWRVPFAAALGLFGIGVVFQAIDTLQAPRKFDWRPIAAFLHDSGVREAIVFSDQHLIKRELRYYTDPGDRLAYQTVFIGREPVETLWADAEGLPVAWLVLSAAQALPPRSQAASAVCSWSFGDLKVVMLARDVAAVPEAARGALGGPACATSDTDLVRGG